MGLSSNSPVGKARIGLHVDTERQVPHLICKRLYTGFQGKFAPHKPYDPEKILKTGLVISSVKSMISDFKLAHKDKDISDMRMSDFYDYFEYTQYSNANNIQQLALSTLSVAKNIVSIIRPIDKKNICSNLPNKPQFLPNKGYSRERFASAFAGARVPSESKLNTFEEKFKEKQNLTNQDFYDFCGYIYPYKRLVGRDISIVLGNIKDRVSAIQSNSSSLKFSSLTPRAFSPYLLGILISLYPTLSIKSLNTETSENHQNILKQYTSNINNIYQTGLQVSDIDFLVSLDTSNISIQDIRTFNDVVLSLIDDLKGIDLSTENFANISSKSKEILTTYTNLFDSSNSLRSYEILSFIENNGKQSIRLQSFKKALLDFHALLIEQNINTPEDDNNLYEPHMYWRKEDEIGNPQQDEISGP